MTTITTVPSIYKNTFFKRSATGILPSVDCGKYSTQTLTWEDVTDMLFLARDDTTTYTSITGLTGFQANYLAYLSKVVAGEDSTNYVTAMNEILVSYATQFVSCSPFGSVAIRLIDNASTITASSDASYGSLYGRTDIIVAQTQIDTVACTTRVDDGFTTIRYYAACAMGSYETNSEFPAHVLRITASYSSATF